MPYFLSRTRTRVRVCENMAVILMPHNPRCMSVGKNSHNAAPPVPRAAYGISERDANGLLGFLPALGSEAVRGMRCYWRKQSILPLGTDPQIIAGGKQTMKKTNFQRIAAMLLCLMFVLGCFAVPVSASEVKTTDSSGGTSSTGQTLADIKELLNAISYEKYSVDNASVPKGESVVVIDAVDALDTAKSEGYEIVTGKYDLAEGEDCVISTATGSLSWTFELEKAGKYTVEIEYYAIEGKAAPIERVFRINGKVPFAQARYLKLTKNWINDYVDAIYTGKASLDTVKSEAAEAGMECYEEGGQLKFVYPDVWTQERSNFCDKYKLRFMKIDVYDNELRPESLQAPLWQTYTLKDSSGYEESPFEFAFEAGTTTITLDGENENMAIKSITLRPSKALMSYEEYAQKYVGKAPGKDKVKLEGEYTATTTDKTIYAVEDRSSAVNSPSASDRTLLNTMGAEKWQTVGQAVTYKFRVNTSGMYDIFTRFRQNILDGIFVNRALYIYSEGLKEGDDGYYDGIPFAEAAALTYNYDAEWQVTDLRTQDDNGNSKSFDIYLEAGVTYTIKLEVTLGALGEIINDVQEALDSINEDYLAILKLTGTTPDSNRDYKFLTVMNEQMQDMVKQSRVLDYDKDGELGVSQKLTKLAGQKSSYVGTLQKISALLYTMGTDDDEVAKNLERLKSYIGNLGTFLTDIKSQPLQIDYMMIQPVDEVEQPVAKAGFWKTLVHEVKSFFWSFFRNYDGMGIMDESTIGQGVEVWLASGRDQSQVIRNLINNDFASSENGSPVDLRLVAGGTLLPSILAGEGPDVYLGLGQADVINYAIRSAVLPIENMSGFKEHTESYFNDAAMLVLGIEDSDGVLHYYGLPEAQGFAMMFVRTDILAELNIEIPKTWGDVMAIKNVLEAQNMEIGLTTDYQIFLYQMGGELFADDGMRINLDSKVGLTAFQKTAQLFTDHGFPYIYNAANRFRTGEMPVVISDYTGLYNQLKVFATEIEGLWQFVPLPGTEITDEDGNVTVNNCTPSSVAATVMVRGCDGATQQARAWEFMKWFTGPGCQADYSNEMVAIMGPSAKYNTANKQALEELPWTQTELDNIKAQFNNLASVPNYPGTYIIGRYTGFAFLAAYNEGADPVEELMSYIPTINKEITRKREEFGLETLELGQTLKEKRKDQAKDAMTLLTERGLTDIAEIVRKALASGDDAEILIASEQISAKVTGSVDQNKINIKKSPEIKDFTNDELIAYIANVLRDVSRYPA